eukprot:6194415-Pleurochrysis_carterae.AAC.2
MLCQGVDAIFKQKGLRGLRTHHVLEEGVPVGGDERVAEVPVDLELAVCVLVVRLPLSQARGRRKWR